MKQSAGYIGPTAEMYVCRGVFLAPVHPACAREALDPIRAQQEPTSETSDRTQMKKYTGDQKMAKVLTSPTRVPFL